MFNLGRKHNGIASRLLPTKSELRQNTATLRIKELHELKNRTPKGVYNTVYESTAAHGGTIFWKLNKDFLTFKEATQCI